MTFQTTCNTVKCCSGPVVCPTAERIHECCFACPRWSHDRRYSLGLELACHTLENATPIRLQLHTHVVKSDVDRGHLQMHAAKTGILAQWHLAPHCAPIPLNSAHTLPKSLSVWTAACARYGSGKSSRRLQHTQLLQARVRTAPKLAPLPCLAPSPLYVGTPETLSKEVHRIICMHERLEGLHCATRMHQLPISSFSHSVHTHDTACSYVGSVDPSHSSKVHFGLGCRAPTQVVQFQGLPNLRFAVPAKKNVVCTTLG